MSERQISFSPDLSKLRSEGYGVAILAGHLLISDVPYVNGSRQVKHGVLVSTLTMAGDVTTIPDSHVAMFAGEYPCDANGVEIDAIRNSDGKEIAPGFSVDWTFSSKPFGGVGYPNYYEKMTAYVAILESPAQAIEPTVTAQNYYPVIPSDHDGSVFNYIDTASSKAGINAASTKLELGKVAIVGLGGTGSYVLDLVAKTWVKEIHLFDGDSFLSHNAFRAPGAASLEELNVRPAKVKYFRDLYSKMRKGLVDHDHYVDASNIQELQGMDFVFVCIDGGDAKKAIVEKLEEFGVRFIDVGMGIDLADDSLVGILRVTSSIPGSRQHLSSRVSLGSVQADDEYDADIQIADLNALNAALAVIKWKKLCGFYHDEVHELHSTYTIDCNMLLSEDGNEA